MTQKHLETEIEYIKQSIQELKNKNESQDTEFTDSLRRIEDKCDKALSQLDMYRHFTVFIRAVLIGIIMIVTLKFGDIKNFFVSEVQ